MSQRKMMNWKNHPRNLKPPVVGEKKNEGVASPRKRKLRSNLCEEKRELSSSKKKLSDTQFELMKLQNKYMLTLFSMDFFGAAHGWGGGKRPPCLKSFTHILQWWNLARLYLTQIRSEKYTNHVTHSLRSADISIFYRISADLAISRNIYIDCILIHNFYLF